LLLFALCLINCQDEPIDSPNETNQEHKNTAFKVDGLGFEQLVQETTLQSLTTKFNISQPIYNRKKGTYQSETRTSSSSSSNDYWIDMSFVNKISSDDYVSYTMRLVEPSNTTSSYSNIVIQEHDGIEEIFTIKYTDNSSSRGGDSMNVKPGIIPFDGWEDPDGDGTGGGGNQYVCTTVAGVVEIQCTGTNSHYVYQDADCTCQRFNQAGVFDNCDRAYYDLVLEDVCDLVDSNGNPVSNNNTPGGGGPSPLDPADIITKKVKLQIPESEFLPLVECIQPTPAQLTWLNEQNLQGGSNELAAIWGFVNPHDSNDCDEKRPYLREAIDALDNDGEVDFEELYISVDTPDDNYIYQGEKQLIPNPLVLSNGDIVTVNFISYTTDNLSSNQQVSIDLIDSIKFSIEQANQTLSLSDKIISINIYATTNGTHGTDSNHYNGTAVDINRINGKRMVETGVTNQIIELQNAFDSFTYIRENFGPHFKHKTLTNGNINLNYPVSDHSSHIHISIRR